MFDWNSFAWGFVTAALCFYVLMRYVFDKLHDMVNKVHKELDRIEAERQELCLMIKSWKDIR